MKRYRLFLVLGLLALGLLGVQITLQRRSVSWQAQPVVRANPTVKRTLSDFEPLKDTTLLVASIYSSSGGKISFSSGSDYSPEIHNYVFANPETLETWRLLPSNDYLILSKEEWPPKSEGQPVPVEQKRHLYSLIKTDTNGDGRLTTNDNRALAIANADGTGLVEVVPRIDHLYWKAVDKNGTLVCIYQKEQKRQLVKIDVLAKRVLHQSELNVGADVE